MVDTVIIHDPDHLSAVFDAAARADRPVLAATAEWAGIAYGALYWAKAVEAARAKAPDAPVTAALHCGDDAAGALAAMREGWRHILFSGDAAVHAKIADIAAQHGAALIDEADDAALDLGDCADARAALTAWMAARRRCK